MSQAVTAVTSLKYLLRFPTAISHRYLQTISVTSLHSHFHHQIFHLSILPNSITIHHSLIISRATLQWQDHNQNSPLRINKSNKVGRNVQLVTGISPFTPTPTSSSYSSSYSNSASTSTLVLMFCCVDCGVEPEGMCELCVEFMITSTWGYLFQLNVTKCQNSLKYYSYLNNEENLNTLYISPVAVSV